jgi:hypothetical protein
MPTRLRRVPDRCQGSASTRTRKTPSRWSLYFFNSLLVSHMECFGANVARDSHECGVLVRMSGFGSRRVQPACDVGSGSKASRHGRKSGKRVEKSCLFRILCEYRRKSGTSPPAATARPGSSANIDENPENAFESAAFSGFSSCEPDAPALPTRPGTVTRNEKDWEGTGPVPVPLRDRASAVGAPT